jgi:hypothetical protein
MVNNFNNIEKKTTIKREEKATTYGVGNPGSDLVQVHKCGGVSFEGVDSSCSSVGTRRVTLHLHYTE